MPRLEKPEYTSTGALFSDSLEYRYLLWRGWGDDTGVGAYFIGLNPSTADQDNDDPTVLRCVKRAKDWGCDHMYMLNLFAIRSTDPKKMMGHDHPVGRDNDKHLRSYCAENTESKIVVACWGSHGKHLGRSLTVLTMLKAADVDLMCLGKTSCGQPKHPLYLPYSAGLERFWNAD